MTAPVYTATFRAQLPAGIHAQVVTDDTGVTLIASADADTMAHAQALLASGFAQVSQAWKLVNT